jgi:hypothetical protein
MFLVAKLLSAILRLGRLQFLLLFRGQYRENLLLRGPTDLTHL